MRILERPSLRPSGRYGALPVGRAVSLQDWGHFTPISRGTAPKRSNYSGPGVGLSKTAHGDCDALLLLS